MPTFTIAEAIQTILALLTFLTLLVVGYQARILRQTLSANTYSQIVDQNLNLNSMLLTQPNDIRQQFCNDPASLMAHSIIDHYENVYVQHRLTNISEEVWPGWSKYMRDTIHKPGPLLDAYSGMYPTLDQGFKYLIGKPEVIRAAIDQLID